MLKNPYIMVLAFSIASCHQTPTLFRQISSGHSGITFNNLVTENDSINPLDMEFLYNGGGVAVGDFNRDGLPDLYFTGSQVSNKLYLNKGSLTFRDITEEAGVGGEGRWCNSASVVDINNDGWPDIYVCTSIKKDPSQRANLLYINQGNDKNGVPVFKEMAKAYNLADTGFSVHAAFFDYDNDGDLDMYLVETRLAQRNSTRFNTNNIENTEMLSDKLYRNEGSDSLGHPFFRDVSKEAGIHDDGYGLGVAIADFNDDGWKDIYVTNDFFTSDVLYINNRDGTFSNETKKCFKHTSQNAMGNDVADINNDGLPDIIAVDMDPEDNYRKKKNMPGGNYFIYQSMIGGNLMLQYARNTLQLNNGLMKTDSGKRSLPSFSDIAFYAGVAETDWSWNPSLADFDNDGFRDLLITNGYPRDVTDRDFGMYRQRASQTTSKEEILSQIPQIKIPNYAFHNDGALRFKNVTDDWGMNIPSFSSGAVYVDLDGDGDLDYVVSNINDEAFVFENKSDLMNKNHWLDIRFRGDSLNKNGLGAIATLRYGRGKIQVSENSPYRGYLSCVDASAHFGLDTLSFIDSVIIKWPGGRQQVLEHVKSNQSITVYSKDAVPVLPIIDTSIPLFTNITDQCNIHFRHQEFDFIDFDIQKLLPHKLSQYGPGIAVGDINGDGLDDVFIGESAGNNAHFLIQGKNGTFIQQELPPLTERDSRKPEMMGVLLFDANGDGKPDLYTASGSNEFAPGTKNYQDRLYINDGKGNFQYDAAAIPKNFTSKSCVKAADFDHDGDLDLFVGGRVNPEKYPEPVSSMILRNDSKNGIARFTDVTDEVAPMLKNIGMVCDAVWTDFDNDGWEDLILAGEWMPITFLRNNHGKLENVTGLTGIGDKTGWWNSILAGDFDNDGKTDYIVGNLGLNSFYRASEKEPVSIYGMDFDKDGTYDAITSLFLKDEAGNKKEYPANTRDDMIRQMAGVRKRFPTYKDFASADINAILPDKKNALVLKANYFPSCLMKNEGNGKFSLHPLPPAAQFAPLNGMVADDINHDGFLDLMVCGNDFGAEVGNGRDDAMNGLVLLGNGNGTFQPLTFTQSGFFTPGDAKGLSKLLIGQNTYAVAATQNRDFLQLFGLNQKRKIIRFNPDDVTANIHLKNGRTRKMELYYGSSYLSQSSRFIMQDDTMLQIEITNAKGEKRVVQVK
ncbi:MAG TPA: VCBS repeat-containing protein [Puia sp.]|nr:VCBS repeat-containing protein [Puia sp.]